MALEVIRLLVPFGEGLLGRLLLVDARSMRFETLAYGWDPDNPLNGTDALTGRRSGRVGRSYGDVRRARAA